MTAHRFGWLKLPRGFTKIRGGVSGIDWIGVGESVSTAILRSLVRQVLDVSSADQLARVIGSWREPALLESGPGFENIGRWSILTAQPRLSFEATGSRWRVESDSGVTRVGDGNVLEALEAVLRSFALACPADDPDPALPPFQGGMVGFLGYDVAPLLERVPRRAPRDSALPDMRLALYDTAIIADRHTGICELWGWDLTDEGMPAVERRCRTWRRKIARAVARGRYLAMRSSALTLPASDFDRPTYVNAVRRVLDYIAAGDVYQVNLSQRFIARGRPEPLDLYLRLKAESPAPFAAFLRWGDQAVASASPELFYQTRGDRLVTRPIKGTRPRGTTSRKDAQLAAELSASPKDRAELTMIVDLERNDLGRVCTYGSVVVSDPVRIESFAQVHHLVATIEGRLRREVGPVDVIRALFPGGSITGAPKIRAMQIIDELEPTRRGLYTGAIGYFSRGGSSAVNIAIRTMIIDGSCVSFQVGGGIVADSDPEAEYEETLDKCRGMLAVVNPRT
jgi:para-aminobenzoate synthetase component 1